MKPPYKESTFSEVDGFGGSDMSDISEEAKLIFRSFNHISDS